MNLSPVIEALRERIGLAPESLGATTLARAVSDRMQALALTRRQAYADHLANDAQEIQRLLDHIAVPETWFFRGGDIFAYLARRIAAVVPQQRARFRILSVPCSTGEEPYSLAIALAEAGVAPAAWEIEAVDLSERHIEKAQQGRFGNFSFRQMLAELRQRYFRPVEDGWELDPVIRGQVRFRQGNLFDPVFLAEEAPFDLCFCRNLFIYLHADARHKALDTLERLLAPEGWLCTGPAEPLEFQDTRFTRAGPVEYFLYRRRKAEEQTQEEQPAPIEETLTPVLRVEIASRPAARVSDVPKAPVDLMDEARKLADAGQLGEALDTCQKLLAQSGPSPALYFLMGVIYQAQRERDKAVRSFQSALYLDPTHAEAVAHLMLLHQESGDEVQVQRLRRRLQRVNPGGEA